MSRLRSRVRGCGEQARAELKGERKEVGEEETVRLLGGERRRAALLSSLECSFPAWQEHRPALAALVQVAPSRRRRQRREVLWLGRRWLTRAWAGSHYR